MAQINLSSQLARITESVKAKNTGDKPESSVVLCQHVRPGAVLALYKVGPLSARAGARKCGRLCNLARGVLWPRRLLVHLLILLHTDGAGYCGRQEDRAEGGTLRRVAREAWQQ